MFVTGINSFGGKINVTFLLKGFGEIFIERVAYLELPADHFDLLIHHGLL
jgi:hypothetical protein